MARFAVGVIFGVVVGTVFGAAAGLHAASEGGEPAESAAPPEAQPVVVEEPAYGVWDRLAQCESTGNWHANTGNGYRGGLQMDATFWARYGGLAFASRADYATRAQQIIVASRGQSVQGWGAWPVCSRVIGVR